MVSCFTTRVSRQKLQCPTAQASAQSAFALAGDWWGNVSSRPAQMRQQFLVNAAVADEKAVVFAEHPHWMAAQVG